MVFILYFFWAPIIFVTIDFIAFLIRGERLTAGFIFRPTEAIAVAILPFVYADFGSKNTCCADSMDTAAFSPAHQLTIAVYMILCMAAYFYASYRTRILPPLAEVLLNCFLMIGLALNLAVWFHVKEPEVGVIGNLPVMLLFLMVMSRNQRLLIAHLHEKEIKPAGTLSRTAWKILRLRPFLKYPVLILLCLPLLALITALLLLTGQKPDSMIRAFTETYKHGFSQWDYQCDNVACGEHYLCSVAANGHPVIVRPQRKGFRHGMPIICNRQLLVSNAFEDLLQEHMPRFHRWVRGRYDRVGDLVHRHYGIFRNKFISDMIYLCMKPAEWMFLVVLYLFDRAPENRIAKQYLKREDRVILDNLSQ